MSVPAAAAIIVALVVVACGCFGAAWHLGRKALLAEQDDPAQLPPLDESVLLARTPPHLPSAGLLPVDPFTIVPGQLWSAHQAHQQRVTNAVAAEAAKVASEIRMMTAEAEQRIPPRWRQPPPTKRAAGAGRAMPRTKASAAPREGTRQPRPRRQL